MLKIVRAVTVFAAFALPTACDGSGPAENSFVVTITGDTTLTFEGEASFGVSTTNGRDHWVLFLGRGVFGGVDFDAVAIGRNNSATPIGVGVHTIEDATREDPDGEDIEAVYALARSHDQSIASYASVSGTLTISSATADQIQGEFSFSSKFILAVASFAGVENLTITGSFTATPGAIPTVIR